MGTWRWAGVAMGGHERGCFPPFLPQRIVNRGRGIVLGFTSNDWATAVAMDASVTTTRKIKAAGDRDAALRELELAAEIQTSLLPKLDPAASPVQGLNRPARLVSGDFYDYLELPDGRFPFALGDVSGKGMNAALLMAKTVSIFRCLCKAVYDPGALVRTLNRELYATATRGMFVTMVVGIYNPRTGKLRFANAGHEPALLRLPDRSYRIYEAQSPPLGILPEIEAEAVEIDVEGGEFYVFSDGLTEFCYGDGEFLGSEGLIQMVEASADMPLATRVQALLAELDQSGWEAGDDLTVLTVDGAWMPRSPVAAPTPAPTSDLRKLLAEPMDELFELTIRSRPDRLKLARAGVKAAALFCGFDDATAQDIVLAVDEACANVIVHGYRGQDGGGIRLTVYRLADGIRILIADDAPAITLADIQPRDLETVAPGGLGTHLIRAVMDEIRYLTPPETDGNVLELIKRIGGNP
jgi:phosphoserine phosphatase RsbU/P